MQLGRHNKKRGGRKKKDSKGLKNNGEKINANGWAKREDWYGTGHAKKWGCTH
jgi:hypothetical protein